VEAEKAAEAARLEAERFEQECLAADELRRHQESETRRLGQESLEKERLEADLSEREQRAREEAVQNQMEHSSRGGQDDENGWDDGDLYEDEDDLDGMYDDEESEDDAGGVSVEHPRPIDSDHTPSAGEPDAGNMERDVNANDGSDLPTAEQQPSEASFFDAAAAVTSASTSMQSMFESNAQGLFGTSAAATSMFSWGGSEAGVEDSSGPVSDEAIAGQPQHGEVSNQSKTQQPEARNGNATTDPTEHQSDVSGGVPQHTLDNFVKQLERMTESHQLEMDELQRTHRIEMDRLQAELDDEKETKKKDQARKEVASQDKFLKQVREMEKQCNAQLEEKENQLREVTKRNEGMALKLNTLKREVDGLAKLVDERDDEIATLKQGHGTTMLEVEDQVKIGQEGLARRDAEISKLKSTLSMVQTELDERTESYNTLKGRAKAVATELKDRRVEVRNLTASNEELVTSNATLETQVTNLSATVNQHEITLSYKEKDLEVLNDKVKELNKQIEQGRIDPFRTVALGRRPLHHTSVRPKKLLLPQTLVLQQRTRPGKRPRERQRVQSRPLMTPWNVQGLPNRRRPRPNKWPPTPRAALKPSANRLQRLLTN